METGFLNRPNFALKTVVFVPHGIPLERLPTILFLHGMGESGTDGIKQSAVGLPQAIRLGSQRWPFLVVMPQKPTANSFWADYRDELADVLKSVEGEFSIDPSRLYLTGLSQGGRGTFDLAKRLPWKFAAAAPICGWTETEHVVSTFADLPIWAFHGSEDDVVPPDSGKAALEALITTGANAKFTLYDGVNHNSWDPAYAEADLPAWFLRHSVDKR